MQTIFEGKTVGILNDYRDCIKEIKKEQNPATRKVNHFNLQWTRDMDLKQQPSTDNSGTQFKWCWR